MFIITLTVFIKTKAWFDKTVTVLCIYFDKPYLYIT